MKVNKIIKRIIKKHNVIAENEWEHQYVSGRWEYLNELKELARYSLIIGYLNFFKPSGAILDVGCGEGLLFERMCSCSYTQYVGIDISETAINKAIKKKNEKSSFLKTGLENYSTNIMFDVIIFNEVLYYLEDPMRILKHYKTFLKDDGIFIISMYNTRKNIQLWKKIDSVYMLQDETKISNKIGVSWTCKVYK